MRLFVALDIPEAVRAALKQQAGLLAKVCPHGRWVRLEGAHVTLKFIGEVPADRVEAIESALGGVRSKKTVEIQFAGLGFFPSERRPRVLWAGVQAGPELARLAVAVDESLAAAGVPRETRDFRPHITLARFESGKGLDPLREAIAKLNLPDFGRTAAAGFYLYQSVLRPGGAEYTRLASYHFSGEPRS